MEISRAYRRLGLATLFSAFSTMGCLSDHEAAPPMAAKACPDGLALRVENIGLSYAVVRVDSCAARAGRFVLDHEINGDSAHDVFLVDEHTGWYGWAKYPIVPGSTSHYRITAYFKDSTRLESNLLSIDYPDSTADFAPIEEGQSYAYAYAASGSSGSNGYTPISSVLDSGIFGFTVLARHDSSGIAIYQVEYRDSLVHSTRPFWAADSPWVREILRSRDTTRCEDDGDSVRCDLLAGGFSRERLPWASAHVLRSPNIGLVMPVGGVATSCAHAVNQQLPKNAEPQAVYLPAIGLVQFWESTGSPHSPAGTGGRTEIRLLARNGVAVDYRGYADLCSRDFPTIPIQ
jgi:hypothetical protein